LREFIRIGAAARSASLPSSLQWSDVAPVPGLDADVKDLQVTRRLAHLRFPFSIPETVEFYRIH
jgi:hypothetical protein